MTNATLSSPPARAQRRAAPHLLILLMILGSFALWLGVPYAGTWLASKVANTGPEHGSLSILLTIAGMVLFAVVLSWLNNLYLRSTRGPEAVTRPTRYVWNRSMRDEPYRPGVRRPGDPPWRVRGPLELILSCSFVVALAAFLIWYFLFADSPPLVTFGGGYR